MHRLVYAEYGIGDFYRSFTITEAVDRDKIEARLKDGVLKIILPKAEASKPKQIMDPSRIIMKKGGGLWR